MPNWSESPILVVDDSALQREFVVALLHELGFVEVLQASDGMEALQILENKEGAPVEFVLSDLDMPGMDGIELMRTIAQHKWANNLIVMTARDPRLLDAVESMALEDKDIHLLGAFASRWCESNWRRFCRAFPTGTGLASRWMLVCSDWMISGAAWSRVNFYHGINPRLIWLPGG